jgi:hypothetical protein
MHDEWRFYEDVFYWVELRLLLPSRNFVDLTRSARQ